MFSDIGGSPAGVAGFSRGCGGVLGAYDFLCGVCNGVAFSGVVGSSAGENTGDSNS